MDRYLFEQSIVIKNIASNKKSDISANDLIDTLGISSRVIFCIIDALKSEGVISRNPERKSNGTSRVATYDLVPEYRTKYM